jgi:putative ABC transport system substrate-binding protein
LRWSAGLGALAGASALGIGASWSPTPAAAQAGLSSADGSMAQGVGQVVGAEQLTWVKLPARTLANWALTQDTPDGLRFTLSPKNLAALQGQRKQVMVLFTKPLNTFDATLTKILDVLAEKQVPVSLTLLNYQQDRAALRTALAFAEANRFDLLAPMGSEVTEHVHDDYPNGALPALSLFTKDPVLQGWVADYEHPSDTNLAYCSVAVPIEVQLAYLRELKANVQNIAVLYSDTSKSTIEAQVEPLKRLAATSGLTVTDVVVHDDLHPQPEFAAAIPAAMQRMAATDPNLERSVFWATGTTAVINSIDLISQLAGTLPVMSVYPDLVQEGEASAVLSVGIAYENVGYLDTVYLLDLLYNGKKPSDLKVGVISPPDLAISFLKAREIGLRIPFRFFENAGYVYDREGRAVRQNGQVVQH